MTISTSKAEQLEINPLGHLCEMFQDKIQQVDAVLKAYAYSDVSMLPLVGAHIIESGGKRIRPLLTLAAASLCGYNDLGDRDVRMAACIEFLHTATLLHDDVVDESVLRRGKPTSNTLWGNQISVLTGDFLFVKLFQLLVQDGSLDILNLFVSTTQTIVEGEVLQIGAKASPSLSRESYFKIIESKTAVLFEAALTLGGLLAGASQKHMSALKSYAANLGIIFQLIDDVLDYTADEPALGKSIGNDFFEGQITLPLILLIEKICDLPKTIERLNATIIQDDRDHADFKWVQGMMKEYGVFQDIYRMASEYVKKAEVALEVFPRSPLKDSLIELAHYVTHRNY